MLWTDRIFKNKVRTNQEVNQIIDGIENSKKTMGNFISEVRKSYALSDSVRVELDKILADRNYLVHKYFKLNIEKFYSEIGRLEMIELFCKFCDDSKKMEEQLKHYYKMYTDKLGITDEQITKIINDIKQQ